MSYTPPPGSGADAAWLVNLGYVSPLGGEADASWGASGSITRYAKIEVPSPLSYPVVRFTIPYPVHVLAPSPLGEPTATAVYTLPYPVYIGVPSMLGEPSVLADADTVLYTKKLSQVSRSSSVLPNPTRYDTKYRGFSAASDNTTYVSGLTVSSKVYTRPEAVTLVTGKAVKHTVTIASTSVGEAIPNYTGDHLRYSVVGLVGVPLDSREVKATFRTVVGVTRPQYSWSADMQYDLYSDSAQIYEWSLEQEYGLRYPTSYWEINQEYSLQVPSFYEWSLDQDYSIGYTEIEMPLSWAVAGTQILYEFRDHMNALRVSVNPSARYIDVYNGAGADIATMHSRNIVTYQYYAHVIPTAPESQRSPGDRLDYVVDSPSSIAENVLLLQRLRSGALATAYDAYDAWFNSPGHYANMVFDGYLGLPNLKFMLGVEYVVDRDIYAPSNDTWVRPLQSGSLPTVVTIYTLNILDLGAGRDLMASTFTLDNSYAIYTPVYEFLNMAWETRTYVHTSVARPFSYSLIVTASHESLCSVMVSAQHEAPIYYSLVTSHDVPYGDRILLSLDFFGEYDIEEFIRVATDHEIRWSSGIQFSHAALYDSSIVVSVQQTFGYEPAVVLLHQQTFGYEPAVVILQQQTFGYDSAAVLLAQQDFGYEPSVRLGAQQVFSYEPSATLSVQQVFGYEPSVLLVVQHRANYDDSGHVEAQHVMTYLSNVRVVASKIFGYGDTIPVLYQMVTEYDIRNVNYVLKDFSCFYTIYSGDALISMEDTVVTVSGVEIDFNKVEVSTDEGDISWSIIIEVAEVSAFSAISRLDPVSVFLGGVEYVGFVDTKSINRSDVDTDISMSLTAYSPAALLDTPYAPVADYVLTERQSSREVVENILGQPVDWRIVDWAIPPYRFAAKESTPAEAARMIVEAVGGVLESNPDGTLYARYAYPVSVPEFASTAPDHTLSDIEDNISSKANFYRSDTYDMFRVQEGEGVNEDVLEFTKNEDSKDSGILRAYPSPWRPSVLSVTHTDGPSVNLSFLGVRSREVADETVEILEGVGRLNYPAVSVVRYEWLSTPMGDVFVEPRTKHLNVSDTSVNWGYGLIRVTYVVESMDYDVQFPIGNEVQFILLDKGI